MQYTLLAGIKVLFIAGFGPIITDQKASEHLYRDLLRLPLEPIEGYDDYLYSHTVDGVKHFALWPLDKVPSPASAKTSGRSICPYRRPGWN